MENTGNLTSTQAFELFKSLFSNENKEKAQPLFDYFAKASKKEAEVIKESLATKEEMRGIETVIESVKGEIKDAKYQILLGTLIIAGLLFAALKLWV